MMKKAKGTKSKIDVGQELRNLGVLIEKNNHEIGAVAEQYGSINEKLDSHTEMIEELSSDMKNVKATLISHTETFKSHTEMIGQNAEAISKVAIDVGIIKTDVGFIVTAENTPTACRGDESATKRMCRRSRLLYKKVCPDASPNTPPRYSEGTPWGGDRTRPDFILNCHFTF